MRLVAKCANDLDLYVHYYDDERILTPRADRELKYYTRVVKLPYMLTGPLPENIKSGSCKMLCIDLDQSGRQKILAKHITEGTDNRLCCMMSNPMYMEIFPSYAGKGPAVTKLLSLLDLKRENSFAAGDEENDISMLKSAGCGIVPANARAEVKASADLVCERDNDHDALTDIILGSL